VHWLRLWRQYFDDESRLGVKKNTCGSGHRPTLFFSADPIIFSTRLTVRPYFLRVVTGCCQNGVCCHTNYWKKPWKKYSKKKLFPPTDPNFFTIWNRNHSFYALRQNHTKNQEVNLLFVSILYTLPSLLPHVQIFHDTFPFLSFKFMKNLTWIIENLHNTSFPFFQIWQ
jgi:hypothetical protein